MNAIARPPLSAASAIPSFAGETDGFGDMFHTLWRGKYWLVFATVLGVVLGVWYAVKVAQPIFRATSVVVLDGGPDPVVQFSDFLPTLSGDSTIVNTELEVLRSTSLLSDIVTSEGLTTDAEFNPALRPAGLTDTAIGAIRQRIGAAPNPQTPLANPHNATLESLRSAQLVRNVPDSMVFEITIESPSPDKAARLADAIAERYLERQLETKFEATQQATTWLAEKVAELEAELEVSEGETNAFAAQMELISAETLEILSAQLKDVRDRIAARQAAVDRGEATNRTASRLGALRVLEAELSDKIARQSRDLVTLEQLQREAAADRQIYEYFLARLKETSVQEGIQHADAVLLSRALIPDQPAAPKPMLIGLLAGFVALVLAAIALLAKEAQSATFRTADDLEALTGLPVLGQVPQIPARKREGVLSYVRRKPNSAAAEAIRNLRTSLLMAGGGQGPKVIVSTSSLPAEGKTTQTLTLAQNLTGVKSRVLVIEGDLRKRVFSDYFGAPEAGNLMRVLFDKQPLEQAVWHNPDMGFDVLFGAACKGNAADLYASPKFRRFLRACRRSYDVILIDTPPVLLVPDARLIAQQADAVVYTVRWDKTREKQVAAGLKAFQSVGVEVTGTVLSQISPRGMKRYGYGKDYGTYGSNGYYQS